MILTSEQPVTLIGGGPVRADDLALALALAPKVAAADAGADRALDHDLIPEAVWGDFDSISARVQAIIPPGRLHPVAEQDSTDFEKSLSRIAAPLVIAVGFAGARQDHFLAALNVLARRIGPPCILIAGEDAITLMPPRLELALIAGTRVSLFPMGPARMRSAGLFWPLDGLALDPQGRVGTSNRATGPVALTVETGPVLLMLPREEIAGLARALLAAG
ncbi:MULTISPECIES: thiamine diphosphokinase [unclassified Paracoccus (in: a-proteobacteria)]|uniref:thiamine diphosphokinase n=1 Tax=unclassified Paracoccus (in: a-proteobacteria) TaxID=2688777 RepID=UPI0012B19BEC|nr:MULTISPECIES: thiamine diphosphokinase [unclassified Paracoccus (in: a-proteobacteria)]UXU75240.1 thiamine diphosphokinase [Paracoccus sp. SMMA_5]UXU81141.1 thiamine diphosphokinase [Paracoccus sp. SMMA_5_TC]